MTGIQSSGLRGWVVTKNTVVKKKKKKRRGRLRTGANFTSRSCVIRVGEEIVEIEPRIVIHRENYVKKSGQLLSGKNSFWKNDLFNFSTADLSRWFFLTYLKIRCASRVKRNRLSMPCIDMAMIKIYSNPRIFNRDIYIWKLKRISRYVLISTNIK